MCGIAGAIGSRDPVAAAAAVGRMNAAQRHRGPDGEGLWNAPGERLVLGHRRLSIIDLSVEANQPMASHDGRFVIVFNGEIYNYLELRVECERAGAKFRTRSDTEVILEAYRLWGKHAVPRFKGMFAFALYDAEAKSVFFARDPFGIKPLYYGEYDGALYFASELKALRAAMPAFAEIDDVTVRMFEENRILERGPWTFFRRLRRFPHAHYAVLSLAAPTTPLQFERYWAPQTAVADIGLKEAAREVHRLLKASVALHLRSDVPVGSCLSGGIDSSAIVCLAAGMLPAGQKVNTFTIDYPNHPEINETGWARSVVAATGANPVWIEPTLPAFLADFPDLVATQDEPFGSTSIYAQYAIFKGIAKTPVRVILDGQGADEQFGGYHSLIPYFLRDRLARNFSWNYLTEWAWLNGVDKKKIPGDWRRWAKGLFRPAVRKISLRPAGDYRWGSAESDEFEARVASLQLQHDSWEQMLVDYTLEVNLPELLRYEDRNSMAHSIESRVPFLESELVSFVLSLPVHLKLRSGLTKAVLREAMREVLPQEVRTRRSKLGFPTPELEWMQKGFGLSPSIVGGVEWRRLTVEMWRKGIQGVPIRA